MNHSDEEVYEHVLGREGHSSAIPKEATPFLSDTTKRSDTGSCGWALNVPTDLSPSNKRGTALWLFVVIIWQQRLLRVP